jgi:hypothetical protein
MSERPATPPAPSGERDRQVLAARRLAAALAPMLVAPVRADGSAVLVTLSADDVIQIGPAWRDGHRRWAWESGGHAHTGFAAADDAPAAAHEITRCLSGRCGTGPGTGL